MIEVAIWWTCREGEGLPSKYLIEVPTDKAPFRVEDYFSAAPQLLAIRRALTEFEKEHADCRPTRIDVRDTPDKVLQP